MGIKNFIDKKEHGQEKEEMGGLVDIGALGAKLVPGDPLGQNILRRKDDEDENRRANLRYPTPHGVRPHLMILCASSGELSIKGR
jgi:hypothetical protein